jgi:hypothetical protein
MTRDDLTKRGVILDVELKNLRGRTVFALIERLNWLLPQGGVIGELVVEDGKLRLRIDDHPALPVVPEGERYPVLELFEEPHRESPDLRQLLEAKT